MEIRTIRARARVALPPGPGRSTFEHYFGSLFPELRECWFVVDNWRPESLNPGRRVILGRCRVAHVNVGRRAIDVYRGKRFLPTFGFAVPDNYGMVFAFAAPPDEATLRSSTWDGYQIHAGKLTAVAVASFAAFEGAWTFATTDLRLVEVLSGGLPSDVVLEEPSPPLRGVFGQP